VREGLKIQQQKSPSLLGEGDLGEEAKICENLRKDLRSRILGTARKKKEKKFLAEFLRVIRGVGQIGTELRRKEC
jgi:hypothetical protein